MTCFAHSFHRIQDDIVVVFRATLAQYHENRDIHVLSSEVSHDYEQLLKSPWHNSEGSIEEQVHWAVVELKDEIWMTPTDDALHIIFDIDAYVELQKMPRVGVVAISQRMGFNQIFPVLELLAFGPLNNFL